MKTLKVIKTDIKKYIFTSAFLVCILITFVLCFTAQCYTDIETHKAYTIFDVMRSFSREKLLSEYNFSSISVLYMGLKSWLTMFIPIVSSFAFIPVFCDERSSGYLRFEVHRSGNKRMYFSKLVSSFLSGGLAVSIGYILFGIVIFIFFPSLSKYDSSFYKDNIFALYNGKTLLNILKLVAQMFLFAGFWALPAFALSSVIKNKYVLLCVPFMLKYIYDQVITKLICDGVSYNKIVIFKTDSVLDLFYMLKNKGFVFIFYISVIAVLFIFYIIFMNRRLDYGE